MLQNQDFSYLYTEEERARFDWCRREQGNWNYRPLISIVVPVYKTPVRLLNEMIGSVVRQSYPQWELCIANASPEDGKLCEALAAWQREDGRIHVQELAENGGISANTNACFAMVQGEYTAMLDHDDMLTENALAEVVWLLQKQPETDFIYSDQDMLEEDSSKRFNPLYKPQWSKDCMYAGNYITHFSVLRTSLIQKIGGWDPSTDGAQDWDLFLKAAEHTDQIVGIPRILYHWRMASTSTASSMATKTYALEAQLRAIREHLHRAGEPQADVEFYSQDIFKIQVKWNRTHDGDISVIFLDEEETGDLATQIAMVRVMLRLREKEIVVVSRSRQRLDSLKGKEALVGERCRGLCVAFANRAEGYQNGATALECAGDVDGNASSKMHMESREAGTANQKSEILLFLTDGLTALRRKSLLELADWALYDQVAIAAPKYEEENRVIREMGIALTTDGPASMFEGCFTDGTTDCGKNYWYRDVTAVDDHCFAIRRELFGQVGGFFQREEPTFEISGSDLWMFDFCLRLRALGYRHMVSPYAPMRLNTGGRKTMMCKQIKTRVSEKTWKIFCEKYGIGEQDPYYRKA